MIRSFGVSLAKTAVLAGVYVAGAKGAFALAFVHTSIAPVWLPSGIALAGVLLLGFRAVPGVWLGAFLFNATTPVPLWVSAGIAVGNTLEAVTGVWLLRRVGFRHGLDRVRDVLALGGLAALAGTAISASVGVASLWAANVLTGREVASSWLLWWSGDAVGILTITPLLLLWSTRRQRPPGPGRILEAACLAATLSLLVVVGLTVHVPGPLLTVPALVWAAIRFNRTGAGLVSLFISAVVVWATAHGHGPLVQASLVDSLLLTQSVVAVVMATSLLFVALTLERERAIQALRQATAEVEQRNRELERERAQLGEAQRIARLGSWEWDVATDGMSWSEEMYQIHGLAPQSVTLDSREFLGRVHPGDRGQVETALGRARTGGAPFALEHRIVRTDGQVRIVQARVMAVLGEGGKVVRLIGTGQDVTDRKQAEAALEEAKLMAEQASHAKSEYLSRMSHELRTPLNAILGFSQLLEMDELTEEQRDSLRHVLSAARHLLALINEVLDIAAIEAGRFSVSLEPVAVADIATEVVSLIRPLADQHGVALAGTTPAWSERILGDRQRLKQVLLNLLSNAVKYNRQGGSVQLACERVPGGRLRIEVADTGPGIAPEALERLFVPFERLGNEHTGIEGAGLGLPLSKRLAEVMGGTLQLGGTGEQGSSFWLELPLADDPVPPDQRRQRHGPSDQQPPPTRSELTVLCLDDDPSDLQLLEQVLSRRPGTNLIPAMRLELGLELANEYHPDLILLDLDLPELAGEELLVRLRADPRTAGIPVVVLGADPPPSLVARLLGAGAHAFLTKPLDVGRFLEVVDELQGTWWSSVSSAPRPSSSP